MRRPERPATAPHNLVAPSGGGRDPNFGRCAPISPPSGVDSILSSGRRLMSMRRAGVSTFNFIRSIRVVPPARNRTSAPCCAVFACAAVATAIAGSSANEFKCMHGNRSCPPACKRALPFGTCWIAATILGYAPSADVAAHQFLHPHRRGHQGSLSSATADMIWPEVQYPH